MAAAHANLTLDELRRLLIPDELIEEALRFKTERLWGDLRMHFVDGQVNRVSVNYSRELVRDPGEKKRPM